jgi:hypothetical protein
MLLLTSAMPELSIPLPMSAEFALMILLLLTTTDALSPWLEIPPPRVLAEFPLMVLLLTSAEPEL